MDSTSAPVPIKAIIFDMDGLMVDTEPLAQEIWTRILAGFGHTLEESVYAQVVGRRSDETVHKFKKMYGLPVSENELAAMKNGMWAERLQQPVPPKAGLYRLHDEIARQGIPWAVATSSPHHYAERVLQQLALWPTHGAFAGGDEVIHGKPAPDVYLLAAQRLGVEPTMCLALEDSVPGGRAAQAAGMTLVAVPAGTTSRSDFTFAPFVYDSLADVARDLKTLLNLATLHSQAKSG